MASTSAAPTSSYRYEDGSSFCTLLPRPARTSPMNSARASWSMPGANMQEFLSVAGRWSRARSARMLWPDPAFDGTASPYHGGVQMTSFKKYSRVILMSGLALAGCGKSGPPYSVTDALKTFKLEPGFHVEKYLSEPDVESPVAMEVDENGRVYVVEDRGYPLSTDNPLGRVKMIEDTNGDGIPDRVTIFTDKLIMPTGVMRWKKGILVTDAPNVW